MDATIPFSGLAYCRRCCMPETQAGITFDDFGICQACQSQEQKMRIDWEVRGESLRAILERARERAGTNYDCIVPISGGKDSVFQLHVLKNIYQMNPLAVTFSHNWFSEIGWYNLLNALEVFSVDHMMFTPNRSSVNRLARGSLAAIGDACWHCHAGVGSFPLQIAVKFNIPLLIWGESVAEYSGRASHENPVLKFDRDYFLRVSAKKSPEEMISGSVTATDVQAYEVPSVEDCERVGLHGIHLGDYIFWDEERQTEFVKSEYGWKETTIEGTYKGYKSAECVMPGVHDFANYLKRGYGRTSFHASMDVRSGLLSRAEAFAVIADRDSVRPEALDYYLQITEMSEQEFYSSLDEHRHQSLRGQDIPVTSRVTDRVNPFVPFVNKFLEAHRKTLTGDAVLYD